MSSEKSQTITKKNSMIFCDNLLAVSWHSMHLAYGDIEFMAFIHVNVQENGSKWSDPRASYFQSGKILVLEEESCKYISLTADYIIHLVLLFWQRPLSKN